MNSKPATTGAFQRWGRVFLRPPSSLTLWAGTFHTSPPPQSIAFSRKDYIFAKPSCPGRGAAYRPLVVYLRRGEECHAAGSPEGRAGPGEPPTFLPARRQCSQGRGTGRTCSAPTCRVCCRHSVSRQSPRIPHAKEAALTLWHCRTPVPLAMSCRVEVRSSVK